MQDFVHVQTSRVLSVQKFQALPVLHHILRLQSETPNASTKTHVSHDAQDNLPIRDEWQRQDDGFVLSNHIRLPDLTWSPLGARECARMCSVLRLQRLHNARYAALLIKAMAGRTPQYHRALSLP